MSTIYYSKYFIASLEHSVVGKVLNCAREDSYGSHTGPKSFAEPNAIFPHFYTQDVYQSHSTPIYILKVLTKKSH